MRSREQIAFRVVWLCLFRDHVRVEGKRGDLVLFEADDDTVEFVN